MQHKVTLVVPIYNIYVQEIECTSLFFICTGIGYGALLQQMKEKQLCRIIDN